MGGDVFPPCYLTSGQTMVGVMKIMATFKRSHTCTATLSAPNPVAGHHWPTPPLETPGHSWASLGQSLLWGSLLLSPGYWCAQGSVCALQESVSPVLYKFWGLYGGVNGAFLQEGLCHTQVCCIQSPCPCRADPYLHRRHSNTQRQVWLSLCRFSWCTQGFVWALQASPVGMGFDSKHTFAPRIIFLGLLLCPWKWGTFFWWDPTFSCRQLFRSEL